MPNSGVQMPEKGEILVLNAQPMSSSGVQTPEKGRNLALNAHSSSYPGNQTSMRDQTPTSADNNSLKKASQPASVGNKPAATKVEEYKAKIPYP